MKHLYFFITLLCAATLASAQAPSCRIISFDHFGGNISDVIKEEVLHHEDGSFSLTVGSNSTSGGIYTDCTTETGGTVIMTYAADYSTLLAQGCAPKGSNFRFETLFFYPQPGGDIIQLGMARDSSGTNNNIAIERRSASGEVLWNRQYGGSGTEGAGRVALASDGTFLVLSGTTSNDGDVGPNYDGPFFGSDMWLVKIDTAGNLLWGKVLGGTGWDLISTIIPDNNGGCYLFGATPSGDYDATGSHGNTDVWVVKMDGEGNKEWHKMLGGSLTDGSGYDNGVRAIRDSGSGFYIAARTNSTDGDIQTRIPGGEAPYNEDIWLLHVDSLANILWENTYGGTGLQTTTALVRGADGSIWVAGKADGGDAGGDINVKYYYTDGWVVHTDSLGNLLNQRVIGASKEEAITMLHPLSDGSVLAGGYYLSSINPSQPKTPGFPDSGEGDADVFIARLAPDNDLSVQGATLDPAAWALYPNPGEGAVTVAMLEKQPQAYRLSVYAADGRQVYTASFRDRHSIDTSGWAAGLYTVTLQDAKGNTGMKKLVLK